MTSPSGPAASWTAGEPVCSRRSGRGRTGSTLCVPKPPRGGSTPLAPCRPPDSGSEAGRLPRTTRQIPHPSGTGCATVPASRAVERAERVDRSGAESRTRSRCVREGARNSRPHRPNENSARPARSPSDRATRETARKMNISIASVVARTGDSCDRKAVADRECRIPRPRRRSASGPDGGRPRRRREGDAGNVVALAGIPQLLPATRRVG